MKRNPYLWIGLFAVALILLTALIDAPFMTFQAGAHGECLDDGCGNLVCSGSYVPGDDDLRIYLQQQGAVAMYPSCAMQACYTEEGKSKCYDQASWRGVKTAQVYCELYVPGGQNNDIQYIATFKKSGAEYPCVLPEPIQPQQEEPVVIIETPDGDTELPVNDQPIIIPDDGQPVTDETKCSWDIICWLRKILTGWGWI